MDEAASVRLAGAHGRPVATADTRILEVPGALGALLQGGVRRGSTLVIGSRAGGVSLALTLAAVTTGEGAWAAAVGLPSLGLRAAAELGVALERLALVPDPGERWPAVVAALVDGMDLLLLGLPDPARSTPARSTPARSTPARSTTVRPADARRLVARTRERGTVLVVLESSGSRWPEPPDLRMSVAGARWEGLGWGHGHLRRRRLEVLVSGRRAATRERRATLWLPGETAAPSLSPVTPSQSGPPAPPRSPAIPPLPVAAASSSFADAADPLPVTRVS